GSTPTPASGVKWPLPSIDAGSVQVAKTRLYGLQGIPALARVFRFVVDVQADLGDMDVAHERSSEPPIPVDASQSPYNSMAEVLSTLSPANFYELDTIDTDAVAEKTLPSTYETFPVTHYLFLTSAADGTKQPWTTAKLRYPTGSAWHGKQVGGKG